MEIRINKENQVKSVLTFGDNMSIRLDDDTRLVISKTQLEAINKLYQEDLELTRWMSETVSTLAKSLDKKVR